MQAQERRKTSIVRILNQQPHCLSYSVLRQIAVGDKYLFTIGSLLSFLEK